MGLLHATDLDCVSNIVHLQASPNGATLAFCLVGTCLAENSRTSYLYTCGMEPGVPRRLDSDGQVWSFCYDQDGMLLYPHSGDGRNPSEESTDFWRMNPATGEAEKAFTVPLAGARATLLTGDRLVLQATWDLELERLRAAGDEQAVHAHLNGDVTVCNELPYRIDGQGYVNGLRERLYEYNCANGALTPITPPSFSQHDFAVSGGKLYVLGEDYTVKSSRRHAIWCWDGHTFAQSAASDCMLSVVAADCGKLYAATDLLPEEADAYVMAADAGDQELRRAFQTRHALFNALSTDIALFEDHEFLAKGGKLYYTMHNRRGVCLYQWENGRETKCSPDGVDVLHFTVTEDGRVFAAGLPEFGCAEIYELCPDHAVRITDFGAELAWFDLVRPEHLVFSGSGGDEIDGWVIPPADCDPGKRYPAILSIHGGPQLRFGGGLHFEHQCWAAQGYFVMYCNPHGSIGDTAAFSNIRQQYGTIDYEDLMHFVDTALAKYPQIDEKRMGVTGISYGGFMTNWIITHNKRFAAAASQAGISDWVSLHATDDTPGFDLTITGSQPWESIREHWRISPLAYAANCTTPTLFLECGDDYRCPVDQGLGMYQALMELGVPTRAVIVRGETHCIFHYGKPRNRLRISQEIMDWFQTHIPVG